MNYMFVIFCQFNGAILSFRKSLFLVRGSCFLMLVDSISKLTLAIVAHCQCCQLGDILAGFKDFRKPLSGFIFKKHQATSSPDSFTTNWDFFDKNNPKSFKLTNICAIHATIQMGSKK